MKRWMSLLMTAVMLVTAMTGFVPAAYAETGVGGTDAQITGMESLVGDADAYAFNGVLYQVFAGEAGMPRLGLTFAKQDGTPFAEGDTVSCVTEDGVMAARTLC